MSHFFSFICNLLPISRRKVVFFTYTDSYGNDPRYVADSMREAAKDLDILWLSEKRKAITPTGIRSIKGKFAMRYHLSTARVIVSNHRLGKYFSKGYKKKPGQFYLQTWHGVGALKKIEADTHTCSKTWRTRALLDSANIDLLLSNSVFSRDLLRACFLYSGEVKITGAPRNDILVNPPKGLSERVRKILGIEDSYSLALYAPTLRKKGGKSVEPLKVEQLRKALKERFGGKWKILIRRHPVQGEKAIKRLVEGTGTQDVSSYPDFSELLLAVDVLITDYSSCAFDYMLTNRPVFLYVPDMEVYEKYQGLLYNPNELPFPAARSNDELENNIHNWEPNEARRKYGSLLAEWKNIDDGKASSRVAGYLLNYLEQSSLPDLHLWRKEIIRETSQKIKKSLYKKETKIRERYVEYKIMGICVHRKKIAVSAHPESPYKALPIQNNKIVFRSVLRGYGCNPKYILEEILRRKLPYELVWVMGPYPAKYNSLKFCPSFPHGVKLVAAGTDEDERELATAKLWIDNYCRAIGHVDAKKKVGQIYINTHHGSYGIKKDGPEFHCAQEPYLQKRRLDAEQIDYLISYSSWCTEYYRRVFWNCGEIKQFGSARNDVFFLPEEQKSELRHKVCKTLGVEGDKNIILYAPSWRPRARRTKNLYFLTLDYVALKDALKKKFGGDWVVLTRLHQVDFTGSKKVLSNVPPEVVDASEYDDMQELLIAADVMISDYSSCIFDYLHTCRPAFIYTSDDSEYLQEWGLYFPLEETPFPWAKDKNELLTVIQNFDQEQYAQRVNQFLRDQGTANDGHATERVVDLIQSIMPS